MTSNEAEKYLDGWKEIQNLTLNYIYEDDNKPANLNLLIQLLINKDIAKDKEELSIFLKLILNVSNNCFRCKFFFYSIEQILIKLCDQIKFHFSNKEIFSFFQNHKRILLILFQNNIIILDKQILELLCNIQIINCPSIHDWLANEHIESAIYFYPEIKKLIPKKTQIKIENQIKNLNIDINYINEKRKNGENDLYLCELIRNDSIDEFIDYVNRTNIELENEIISSSLFETNNLLKYLSLLEYAMFFGSSRIVKYLYCSGVQLSSGLWPYAIHGNNSEIIHFLEEKQIYPNFNACIQESIKCFNDDITNYILNTFINDRSEYEETISYISIDSLNFQYFPDSYNENVLTAFYNQNLFNLIEVCTRIPGKKYYIKDLICKSVLDKNERISNCLMKCVGVPYYLFWSCKSLININIPFSVTSIGNHAFYNCYSLEEVVLPSSLNIIGESSFECCHHLVKLNIPPSVTKIGSRAFYYCNNLNIIISATLKSAGIDSFYKCKSVVFENNVTTIPEHMFDGSYSYDDIKIPSSITTISSFAFNECNYFNEITIPFSVTYIKPYAFKSCTQLKKITLSSQKIIISPIAFEDCPKLDELVFDATTTVIHKNILNSFPYLKTVTIPLSVISIDDYAFYKCTSLQTLNLPSSVKTIGKGAFKFCSSLKNITLPPSLESIGSNAFDECKLIEHLFVPSSMTYIGSLAFNCRSLRLAYGTKKIFHNMFHNYDLLEHISIPSSVTSIEDYAFHGCCLLKNIKIPSSVRFIGQRAFKDCSSLKNILILSTDISIGPFAFESCSSVILKDGMKSIPEKMFSENSRLTRILIPLSVTHIKKAAFYKCTSLEQITFHSSIKSIGSDAFFGCSSLKKIIIPSSVTFIGYRAFYCCHSLKELLIPLPLISIKESFFQENDMYSNSKSYTSNQNNLKLFDHELHVTNEKVINYHIKKHHLLLIIILVLLCFSFRKLLPII